MTKSRLSDNEDRQGKKHSKMRYRLQKNIRRLSLHIRMDIITYQDGCKILFNYPFKDA